MFIDTPPGLVVSSRSQKRLAKPMGETMRPTKTRCLLDMFMLAAFFCLLPAGHFPVEWFHEVVGLAIAPFIILHLAINWACIRKSTGELFRKGPASGKVNCAVNGLLLAGFLAVIISGMAISRTIDFSWLGFNRENALIFRSLHVGSAMIVLILLGAHLGLHWDWVLARLHHGRGVVSARRTISVCILIGFVSTGACLSWHRIGMNEKIGMMFRPAAAGEHGPGLAAGHHGLSGPGARGGDRRLSEGEEGAGRQAGPGEAPGSAADRQGRHSRHPSGVLLSIAIIICYMFIMAFFIMAVSLVDVSIRKGGRKKPACPA